MPAIDLDVDLQVIGSPKAPSLTLTINVHNRAAVDYWILDQLWCADASSARVRPDPERAYRFVVGDCFVILLGMCPLPRTALPTYKIVPDAQRLPAGATVKRTLTFEAKEHSAYFPEGADVVFAPAAITTARVALDVIDATPDYATSASPAVAGATRIDSGQAWDTVERIEVDTPVVASVRKRSDWFEGLG